MANSTLKVAAALLLLVAGLCAPIIMGQTPHEFCKQRCNQVECGNLSKDPFVCETGESGLACHRRCVAERIPACTATCEAACVAPCDVRPASCDTDEFTSICDKRLHDCKDACPIGKDCSGTKCNLLGFLCGRCEDPREPCLATCDVDRASCACDLWEQKCRATCQNKTI